MTLEEQLWRTEDRARAFILPDAVQPPPGPLAIRSLAGEEALVDPDWLARYEVSGDEAHAWATREFGIALGEARRRIDAKLGRMRTSLDAARAAPVTADSELTADALPALLSLVTALPRAILDGLSGDDGRVSAANGRLGDVEARLERAGIRLGGKVAAFPCRLAGLREETARARRDKS
jgi:hypothetical protein